MDVFQLRDQVVQEYADYTRGFLHILDPAITHFVAAKLADGTLWPDALVQVSPTFKPAHTIEACADAGTLHADCATIFKFLMALKFACCAIGPRFRGLAMLSLAFKRCWRAKSEFALIYRVLQRSRLPV